MAARISQETLMVIYRCVGEIVVAWALTEQLLDNCITVFFHGAGGKNIQPDLPVTLKRKLKFARRCLKTLAPLSRFKNDGMRLLDEIGRISDVRHTVVHGALSTYDSKTETITFVKLKAVRDKHWVDPRRINARKLLATGGDTINICTHLGKFVQRLLKEFVPEDVLNKPRRRIRS